MPEELERIKNKIKAKNPSMPESSAWAIATNAWKRKHNIPVNKKITEEEMERIEKSSVFWGGFSDELEKIAAETQWTTKPSFSARHPILTTIGGAYLGSSVGALPGQLLYLMAPSHPYFALGTAALGSTLGTLAGGYLAYQHAQKRKMQYLQGRPEGMALRKVKAPA